MFSMIISRGRRALSLKILAGLLAACGMAANAAIVQYNTAALGGGFWRYDYTLQGAAPAGGFDGLTIYFEVGSYGQLVNTVTPLGWDPLVVQPDINIPADGFIDLFNTSGLIAGNVGPIGFSFDVEYIGAGAPSSQRFELYQSAPFSVVLTGRTDQLNGVPEPATDLLVMLALSSAMLLHALQKHHQLFFDGTGWYRGLLENLLRRRPRIWLPPWIRRKY